MPGEKILVVEDCDTVRELVGEILEEGGYKPLLAPDGTAALEMAQSKNPDLILVDFIMPKMNGLRFCQILRNIDNLKGVPIILVSVKAESIGAKFIEAVNLADSISKPFTAQVLLAVVEHHLTAQRRDKGKPERWKPPNQSAQYNLDEMEAERAASCIRKKIIAALKAETQMGAAPSCTSAEAGSDAPTVEWERALSDDFLKSLVDDFRRLSPLSGIATFAGTSSSFSVGEILQLLCQSKKGGMLKIGSERRQAAIYVRDGKICFARLWGGSEEFLLGRYLLKEELITKETLERMTSQKGSKLLFGERLVKTGLITKEELSKVLEQQITEIVYEVLRWENVHYTFHPGLYSPEAEASPVALNPGETLMEGYRRVDEWRLIEKEIKGMDMVPSRANCSPEELEGLSSQEALVLDFVDGVRSVGDIIKETKMATFDVCKILYQLISMKIIRSSDATVR